MTGISIALMAAGVGAMPAFIDAGTGGYEAPVSGTLQVPYPATVVAGNFLLMHVVAQDAAAAITTPAGWTLIDTYSSIASTLSNVFWKRADGTETGNVDITTTAGIRCGGRIYRFTRGSGVEAAASTGETGSDSDITIQNVTTLGSRRLACQCLWIQNNTTMANITGESGADYTEATAEFGNTGFTIGLQTAQVATAAAITGGTCTIGAATTNKIAHGFAIKP